MDDDIINARNEGKLVIFAGAGISMADPSNLPDFKNLVKEITGDAYSKNEPEDLLLGRLKRAGTDVNSIVSGIIGSKESLPTALHYNLIKLFKSPDDVKIITTNYDRHFSTVIKELFSEGCIEEFYAPAMPLGRDFKGIIYLHGHVDKNSNRMVVDDCDFGKAYLTDGWATHFLKDVFNSYVVLFIGYSHDDTVMKYLSRGLSPTTKRYAIIPQNSKNTTGEKIKWNHLGITPIIYPLRYGKKHTELYIGIEELARRLNYNFSDHKRRIKEIVENEKFNDIIDNEYLSAEINDPVKANYFVKYAKTLATLKWIEDKPVFRDIFTSKIMLSRVSSIFASWFAMTFVCNYSSTAFEVCNTHKQNLSVELLRRIVQELTNCKLDVAEYGKWVDTILRNYTVYYSSLELYWLDISSLVIKHNEKQYKTANLQIFKTLTQPYINFAPGFSIQNDKSNLRAECIINIERENLEEMWNKVFKLDIDTYGREILKIIKNHFTIIYDMLSSVGQLDKNFDSISYERINISDSDSSIYTNSFDVLINICIDILNWLLENDYNYANNILHSFYKSNVQILVRIALYGINQNEKISANEKIKFILDNNFLYKWQFQAEVFEIIKNAYPCLTQNARRTFFKKVLKSENINESNIENALDNKYEIYNLTFWIYKCCPDCKFANLYYQKLSLENPEFGPRENPNLSHSIKDVSIHEESPISSTEIVLNPISNTIELITKFNPDSFSNYSRYILMSVLIDAVSKNTEWSFILVKKLNDDKIDRLDIWESIIRGWGTSDLNDEQWGKVLLLLQNNLVNGTENDIASLLETGASKESGMIPFSCIEQAISLSKLVWDISEDDIIQNDNAEWITISINSIGGKLTHFYILTMSRIISKKKDELFQDKLDNYKEILERILKDETIKGQMGRIIIASQLRFLFWFDKEWTKKMIFPLFDWDVSELSTKQAWNGYLFWGNWDKRILLDILPLFEQSFSKINIIAKKNSRFCQFLASIAIHGSINPLKHGWLNKFIRFSDEESREVFAKFLSFEVKNLNQEEFSLIWKEWLCEYWDKRNVGLPLKFTDKEYVSMIIYVSDNIPIFPCIVNKMIVYQPEFCECSLIFYNLNENDIATKYPNECLIMINHLIHWVNVNDLKYLENIYQKLLLNKMPNDKLIGFKNVLVGLGSDKIN